jgi:hypothetical protein
MPDALVILGYLIAPLVLGIAIGYGVFQWRHRTRSAALEEARNEATREVFRQPSP